jgi:magnesium-transporting ATPase (P-type)
MIDQMYLMLFNLLFTSLPPVAVGVFDRNLASVYYQIRSRGLLTVLCSCSILGISAPRVGLKIIVLDRDGAT